MKCSNRLYTHGKRFALFFLCLSAVTALLFPLQISAKTEPKVVRVGWYESAFHRTDQFGRKSGYGYEYQQRIATYTGWTYEYVEGSWSELFEMLVEGEIDLLSDVSYTEARAEKILYSAEPMGGEDYHVFIAPDNTEIRPDDFSTFNGKRVGVNKNSIQEQLFLDWAEKHDVHPDVVELSVKTPELLEMLENGEIDMLVTLDTYGNSADIVPVCKVGSAASYFGINQKRPDLKQELDTAMNRLLEDNRSFNEQMTEKFNRSGSVNSFLTAEEKDWLNAHGTIRVGYRDGYLPFCDCDEVSGKLTGALEDYLDFAETCEKNAKLSFEPHAYKTTAEALEALAEGEIDCVFPVSLSAYDGEQIGVIITDPFVTAEMYALVRTADSLGVSPEREMMVATVRGYLNHETFVKDHFPDWKITYYENSEDGLLAVSRGEADCALASSYRLSRINELCRKYKLTPLATGQEMDFSFAMKREDDCLYSILNKVSRLMPEAALNASLTNYAFTEERVTFMKFLRDNLALAVAAAAVIASVILFLVLRSMKAEAQATEGRQLISETERDSLTTLYNRSFFNAYAERLYREHPEKPMDAIVMNIERFHTLNLLNGREFGDEVLKILGNEIASLLKETDGIAARTEGDSFEIYCA
ncbi:MAG: transporter substrate-binding domain-containing protein, partial [Solobacterium sp.]|nr:transporter substrate-binding domain-containing protein [Solobacterium sp.]